MDFWISLDFWISDWISADSVQDFFRGGPLEPSSSSGFMLEQQESYSCPKTLWKIAKSLTKAAGDKREDCNSQGPSLGTRPLRSGSETTKAQSGGITQNIGRGYVHAFREGMYICLGCCKGKCNVAR